VGADKKRQCQFGQGMSGAGPRDHPRRQARDNPKPCMHTRYNVAKLHSDSHCQVTATYCGGVALPSTWAQPNWDLPAVAGRRTRRGGKRNSPFGRKHHLHNMMYSNSLVLYIACVLPCIVLGEAWG